MSCGIESWFTDQDEAKRLEAEVADGAVATVKIDDRGNAAIVAAAIPESAPEWARSAAGDGRDHRDLGAVRGGRRQVVEEPHVVVADVDVDEAAQLAVSSRIRPLMPA